MFSGASCQTFISRQKSMQYKFIQGKQQNEMQCHNINKIHNQQQSRIWSRQRSRINSNQLQRSIAINYRYQQQSIAINYREKLYRDKSSINEKKNYAKLLIFGYPKVGGFGNTGKGGPHFNNEAQHRRVVSKQLILSTLCFSIVLIYRSGCLLQIGKGTL